MSPKAVETLRRWKADPRVFVRECLHAEPDWWQSDFLHAFVTEPYQRYCLLASKGPGKSTLLAWLALWFLSTNINPKIVATSVTEANLRDGLWAECAKWMARSPFLQAAFTWTATRIASVDSPETWFMSARTWSRGADSSSQADTLAGIHGDSVMVLVDEAGSIPDAVVAAAEGGLANATPGSGRTAYLVVAGNPTETSGPLWRAATSEAALWHVTRISGDPDDPKRAPRVSKAWAETQIIKYGRDSDWVRVNVFGLFPNTGVSTLLGPDEVNLAMKRVIAERDWADEVKVMSVDVARFGDDRSCIFLRQGKAAFRPLVFRGLDLMQLVGQITMALDKHQPAACFIDSGGMGAGVVDRLNQLGYQVIGVDFGSKSSEPGYANKRTEMYFKMADWIRDGGCLPDMPELVTELTGPRYKFNEANKLMLERKADLKLRIGVSPDLADGLAISWAHSVPHPSLSHKTRETVHEYDPFLRRSA